MSTESIVCMDPNNCDRDHVGGMGGTPVHLPADGVVVPGHFDHGVPSDVALRAADLPDGTVVATETRAWMKNRHGEWRSTAGGNDGHLFRDGLPAGARLLRYGHDGSSDEQPT